MAIGKDGAVRRQLRTLFNVGTVRELTDGQLLERFATDGGEAAELAFAVLVERHGPMVMRVCRGVLADPHDTQDAFQATFLVLVKRARGLWVRDSLGPWLHQVAYRTASCARANAARHRRLERHAAMTARETAPREQDVELERLLHEEIDRLPERYRSPVVLCDLEGRTYEQAARHLGWPVGTVKSRLSRAHGRLRDRLLRRGLAPDAKALALTPGLKVPALPIPPALLDSTTTAAVRFAGMGPAVAVRGSAVSLAEGVLRAMSMTHWWKVATVLLVAGATASGVEWLGQGGAPATQNPAGKQEKDIRAGDVPTREMTPGTMKRIVSARGSVEAAQNFDVYNRIEGQTTIIRIAPEGTKVKKGEVICTLDSAALRDQLVNQRITTKSAEANYLNAKLNRERAELALKEYTDGILKQEEEGLKQAIEGSRGAIRKYEERLERTRKAGQRLKEAVSNIGGVKTPADIVAEVDIQDRIEDAELNLDRERRALAQAEGKKEILEKYTRDRTIRELGSEVNKTRSDELYRQATWELEKGKEIKLERQIAMSTLTAPIDGTLVYANDPSRMFGNNRSQIEEGATVRERQKIVSLFDSNGPMQINAKVDESDIAHIAPRMSVRVKVDAFTDMTMPGVVTDVAPLPDPTFLFMGDRKVYTTRIRIGQRPDGLRPGLTASAEIVAGELENVLSVPAGAVITYGGEDHVAVKMPDGRVEWRVVVLGASDGSNYEVKEGLRSGDKVILEPRPFLSDEQQAKIKSEQEAEAREAAARREAALKAAAAPRRQDVPQKAAVRKRGGRGGE